MVVSRASLRSDFKIGNAAIRLHGRHSTLPKILVVFTLLCVVFLSRAERITKSLQLLICCNYGICSCHVSEIK